MEFLSTFSVAKEGLDNVAKEKTVQFRLCNVPFKMSVNEFGTALGFVYDDTEDLVCGYPEGWTINLAYQKLCAGGKTPHHPKIHQLKDPALRFIHRLLAINISGKNKDARQCSNAELFILQCMTEKRKMHMGF